MNRDEAQGKTDQIRGKIKQAAGDLTDDERLHDEGVADEAAGNDRADGPALSVVVFNCARGVVRWSRRSLKQKGT